MDLDAVWADEQAFRCQTQTNFLVGIGMGAGASL